MHHMSQRFNEHLTNSIGKAVVRVAQRHDSSKAVEKSMSTAKSGNRHRLANARAVFFALRACNMNRNYCWIRSLAALLNALPL